MKNILENEAVAQAYAREYFTESENPEVEEAYLAGFAEASRRAQEKHEWLFRNVAQIKYLAEQYDELYSLELARYVMEKLK